MRVHERSTGWMFLAAAVCLMICPAASRAANDAPTNEERSARQREIDEFTRPGPQHAILQKFEGKWKALVHFRPTPQAPVSLEENSAQAAMILDGRYLDKVITNREGSFNIRITYGFDNYRKEFSMVWIDNQCTGMITSSGKYDPKTGSIEETGLMSSPFNGEPRRWFRSRTAFQDADHYTYEMFIKDDEGEEFRSMLIEFTRLP